ncbi:hypothetical protein TL16_g02968 [Triparma laevis f. inornata]|uniref:Uncharacterized protein n=1 Tax=Triparma laevis f. inornata TaxID=1714386 RepID=A0A9W6ZTC0_9STRA|nr:hypothetical protein TL16_g02968 [Triparma laevis f. inornata]
MPLSPGCGLKTLLHQLKIYYQSTPSLVLSLSLPTLLNSGKVTLQCEDGYTHKEICDYILAAFLDDNEGKTDDLKFIEGEFKGESISDKINETLNLPKDGEPGYNPKSLLSSHNLLKSLLQTLSSSPETILLLKSGGESIYHHGSYGDDVIPVDEIGWYNMLIDGSNVRKGSWRVISDADIIDSESLDLGKWSVEEFKSWYGLMIKKGCIRPSTSDIEIEKQVVLPEMEEVEVDGDVEEGRVVYSVGQGKVRDLIRRGCNYY